LDGIANGLLDRFPSLAGQSQDEGAVDDDAEIAAISGESLRDLGSQTFADIVEYLIVARFIADQQQPKSVLLHDAQGFVGDIGFRIARPRNAQLTQAARNLLGAG